MKIKFISLKMIRQKPTVWLQLQRCKHFGACPTTSSFSSMSCGSNQSANMMRCFLGGWLKTSWDLKLLKTFIDFINEYNVDIFYGKNLSNILICMHDGKPRNTISTGIRTNSCSIVLQMLTNCHKTIFFNKSNT